MNIYYFVTTVAWIVTVAATLETDLNGNWSNEKEKQQQDSTKQILQPYVLFVRSDNVQEETFKRNESLDDSEKLGRIDGSVKNESVTVEYIPSREISVTDSTTTIKYIPLQDDRSENLREVIREENVDIKDIEEDFGQRVQPSSTYRQRIRFRHPFDNISPSEDYNKNYRKDFRSLTLNKSNNGEPNINRSSNDRLPLTSSTVKDVQKDLEHDETQWSENENVSLIKNTSLSTSVPIVSLGKFSGPIIVPDLPRQNKYSYITDSFENNEVAKSTSATLENSRLNVSENSYLTASPGILNALQVGVALMNAGQDINFVNDDGTLTSDKIDFSRTIEEIEDDGNVQNDSPDFTNSSFQSDKVAQQNQISESVSSNLPAQTVEIQKSVEIFHTAPIQEIHYPVEFVPYVQKSYVRQQLQEDYKKPSITHYKNQRPNQVNVYKSNEIADESIISATKERGPYEYNLNEDPLLSEQRNSEEIKPVFRVNEQVDDGQYDQTIVKQSKTQTTDYESSNGPSLGISQSTRLIDNLSSLTNLENLQSTQVYLGKNTNEVGNEMVAPVQQTYPAENTVHASHQIDIPEKRIPFLVEKGVEKQIISQPFAIPIPVNRVVEKQVRIPYSGHVEKVAEKKIPFMIQRFIIPLPIHFSIPHAPLPVMVEKIAEKPLPIPVSMEKGLPRPHHLEMEKNRPYYLQSTKLVKSGPIYNVQNDGNYQQHVTRQNVQAPFGLSYWTENNQNYYNSTGHGTGFHTSNRPLASRQPIIHAFPKKFITYGVQHPHPANYFPNGHSVNYGKTIVEEDNVKPEYISNLLRKGQQSSLGVQTKNSYLTSDIQSILRRTRQEVGSVGSFRQSKMEYGFKPPMVPSVQYDEQTASKVN